MSNDKEYQQSLTELTDALMEAEGLNRADAEAKAKGMLAHFNDVVHPANDTVDGKDKP